MSSQNVVDPAGAWSLAARLTAWYAGSAFLLILAATGFLYWSLVSNLEREDDQFLADKVHILRVFLREKPYDAAPLKQEAEWEGAASQHAQFYVRILDPGGRIIVETPGMRDDLAADIFEAFAQAKQIYLQRLETGKIEKPTKVDELHRRVMAISGDPLPYGLPANRQPLEELIEAALEQGIITRRVDVDELFPRNTHALTG